MRNLILISCCAAFLALASCSKENLLAENPTLEKGEVTLSAAFSRGGEGDVPAEWKIQGVRMIVFSSPKQGQGGGRMVTNVYKPGDNPTFKEIVPVGNIDIYLIANEFDTSAGADNWNLASITSIEELEGKIAKYTNHPEVNDNRPIPMCTRYRMVQIDMNGNMTYNGASLSLNKVKLERIIAKTTLNLGCVFANLPDGGQSLTLESVQIKRMPRFSHLAPEHSYTGDADEDFISGSSASLSNVVYQYGDLLNPGKKTGFTATFSYYLPEYLPGDASKYTYFDIVARPDGNPSVKLLYKLILGDGIDDGHGNKKNNAQMAASGKSSDFTVSRNTHYIFNTQINSYGTIDGMIVDPTVEDWGNPKEVDEDLKGHILNVSNIQTSINDINSTRIYFWSNQKDVVVDPTGYTGETGTTTFTVNSFFDKLSGGGATATNFHYTYNPTTQSGTGYMDLNVIGNTAGDFTHRILLNAGGLKREIKVNSIVPVPWSTTPWVGTFHRWNETGERIIYSNHTGEWSAEVEYPTGIDPFAVLSKTPSRDPKIMSDNPGEAEDYPIIDGTQSVSGNGYIYFRVGMKDKLASAATAPRYAKIKVTCSGGVSYIYVRQGEAPDYVMRPGDRNGRGTTVTDNRSYARKFSPYNLTAPSPFASGCKRVDLRGGAFTAYPSQAGALWQWANEPNYRYAYTPHNSGIYWNMGYPSTYWDKLATTHETCPAGYHRPNDGPVDNANSSGSVANSEMRQSLWLNPPTSIYSDISNSISGYYADGYFDRRLIEASLTSYANSSVSRSTSNVAYLGSLFFNPTTYGSLFFPAAGYLNYDYGPLISTGSSCLYWTSSSPDNTTSWLTHLYKDFASQDTYNRANAFSIRCVIDE